MTLRLTPQNIEDAYNYLKNTAPFNKLNLPESDDLEFQITDEVDRFGHFQADSDAPPIGWDAIGVSNVTTKTTLQLIETVGHEMIHLWQRRSEGFKQKGYTHGPKFKRLAKRVCAAHGFNLETF